jgi:hypothetical protein
MRPIIVVLVVQPELTQGNPVQDALVRLAVISVKEHLTSPYAVFDGRLLVPRLRLQLVKRDGDRVHDRDHPGDEGLVDLGFRSRREALGTSVQELTYVWIYQRLDL